MTVYKTYLSDPCCFRIDTMDMVGIWLMARAQGFVFLVAEMSRITVLLDNCMQGANGW